jgi:hypothetical protein
MSYYKELNEEFNDELNNDDVLQNFDRKRFKKNNTQNTKNIASYNKYEESEIEKVFEDQSCFDTSELEINAANDLNMSLGSNCETKEEESSFNSEVLLDDFLDLSLLDSTEDDEIENDIQKDSPYLFKDSRLNVREFNILFMATVDKLGVPEEKRDMILDLIRFTLPTLNELPVSYYMIQKTIPKPEISSFLLCKICNHEISSSKYNDTEEEKKLFKKSKAIKKCINDECSSNRMGLKSRSFVKVFSLNIFSQLKIIIENNEKCISNYIGNRVYCHIIRFFLFLT